MSQVLHIQVTLISRIIKANCLPTWQHAHYDTQNDNNTYADNFAFRFSRCTFSSVHSDTTDKALMKLEYKLRWVSHWAVAFSKLDYFAQGWCHTDCLYAICDISVITDWILMKTGVKLIWQLHFSDSKVIPTMKTVINGPNKSCISAYLLFPLNYEI